MRDGECQIRWYCIVSVREKVSVKSEIVNLCKVTEGGLYLSQTLLTRFRIKH